MQVICLCTGTGETSDENGNMLQHAKLVPSQGQANIDHGSTSFTIGYSGDPYFAAGTEYTITIAPT